MMHDLVTRQAQLGQFGIGFGLKSLNASQTRVVFRHFDQPAAQRDEGRA